MEFNAKIAQQQNLSFEQWHTAVQITNGDIAGLVHTIGIFVKEEIDRAVAPLRARLEELEVFKYCGTWKEGQQYHAGNFCTDHGSLWHCACSTTSRPGSDHAAWQLAVKRGRDAREKATEPLRTEPRRATAIPSRRS